MQRPPHPRFSGQNWGPPRPPFMNGPPPPNFQRGPGPRGNGPMNGPPRPGFHGNRFPDPQGANGFGDPRHLMRPQFGPGPRFMGGPQQRFPRQPHYHGNHFNHDRGGRQKNNGSNQQKSEKESKFYCDTCDRGFQTDEEYKGHVKTHVKCKDPNCSYVAAGKLVKLHYTMQHSTGLAKKIWSLESKEDIEKWREERRRNYPTAANIAKKKAEQSDKEERGEILDTKYFGKMRGRGRGRGRGGRGGHFDLRNQSEHNRKRQGQNLNSQPECSPLKQQKHAEKVSEVKEKVRDPNADPLSYLLEDEKNVVTTEDTTSSEKEGLVAAGALGSLISAYVASSDSEEDEENEKHSEINKSADHHMSDHRRRRRPKKKQQTLRQQHQKDKPKESLLEKLLAKEIRQERNKILQCVYYIVKQNFFDKKSDAGPSSSPNSTTENLNNPKVSTVKAEENESVETSETEDASIESENDAGGKVVIDVRSVKLEVEVKSMPDKGCDKAAVSSGPINGDTRIKNESQSDSEAPDKRNWKSDIKTENVENEGEVKMKVIDT